MKKILLKFIFIAVFGFCEVCFASDAVCPQINMPPLPGRPCPTLVEPPIPGTICSTFIAGKGSSGPKLSQNEFDWLRKYDSASLAQCVEVMTKKQRNAFKKNREKEERLSSPPYLH